MITMKDQFDGYLSAQKHEISPSVTGTAAFIEELKQRTFRNSNDFLILMKAKDLTEDYFNQKGFRQPILIVDHAGLGLKIPKTSDFVDICDMLKNDLSEVEVIDVGKQSHCKIPLVEFRDYLITEPRIATLNMISLEVSKTRLGDLIEPPVILQNIDLQHKYWNEPVPGYVPAEPQRVEKYCLISPANSYTDFHIDFSGTSVWYHIVKGAKVFYLIKPSRDNFKLFWTWLESQNRLKTFFADQVDACYKCSLEAGSTLFLPTGWIHAVLTLEDTLAFGGNFLHIYNMPMQLDIYEVEQKLRVGDKYIYPYFKDLHWFAAKGLKDELAFFNSRSNTPTPAYLIDGLKRLLTSLKQWNGTCTDIQTRFHNPCQLIKDLTREIRVAERRLLSLSPPKPIRESTRVKRKTTYDDFIQFSEIKKKPKKKADGVVAENNKEKSNLPTIASISQSPDQKWHVKSGGLKVILAKASSEKHSKNKSSLYTVRNPPPFVPLNTGYENSNRSFEHIRYFPSAAKYNNSTFNSSIAGSSSMINSEIENSSEVLSSTPSNGPSESLLSFRIRMVQDGSTLQKKWTHVVPDTDDAVNRSIHQDEDFIYPSLDLSDEEDCSPIKKSKAEEDKAWNPKSKVSLAVSKPERPTRIGKTKIAIEKGLEAAAAKPTSGIQEIIPKKPITPKPIRPLPDPEKPTHPEKVHRSKKGLNTPKQRLSKILKLHKLRR